MIAIETIEQTKYLHGGDRHDYLMYSLSIDGHLILDNKYFSDFQWICRLKEGIEYYFPHLVNLKASAIANHPDKPVLGAYLKHQYNYNKGYLFSDSLCEFYFDENYDPRHFFNYSIPQEPIAS